MILKKIRRVMLITFCIMAAIYTLWGEDVLATSGPPLGRDGGAAVWNNAGWTNVPMPVSYEPLDYDTGYIYIINTHTGQGLRRYSNSSTWDSTLNWANVPLPAGYKPLSYKPSSSSYFYIINPETGETKYRIAHSGGWSATGWTNIPLPAGFEPLAYSSNRILIINKNTGQIKYRYGDGSTWENLSGWQSVLVPMGYAPLTLDSSYAYIYSTLGAETTDPGDTLQVKYSIDEHLEHAGIMIFQTIADATDQAFAYNVTEDCINEGLHTLRVWAEDNAGGVSNETVLNFVVDNSNIGLNGVAVLRVISSEEKAFNTNLTNGSYTDITTEFLQDNGGSGKPFYHNTYSYNLYGVSCSFYDYGSSAAFIGSNTIRAVTSEGKAYDVDSETGIYTDVTNIFLANNFGPGKPFFYKSNKLMIGGWGPFNFHDFGSTMAYIGNNKIRVVTSERKAFDVDKDTGEYVEVNNFLDNNWGSGKPFYLREYTHTIGGEAKTFYDWGSSMTYIGSNTLRVVTSEGKAFDVDKDTGVYTDITSTFLINNFGEGKPFYLRTYPVTINGTSYDFYDWGSTMAYTDTDCPAITITTPREQAAFETITLSGTVSDKSGGAITVSAAIAGVTKTATITNTTTPQDWSLEWDIAADNIPDGSYTDIVAQAENEAEEFSTATYTGTIAVYGPGSGLMRKTAHYEYDGNGKLVRRYSIETD